MLSGVMGAIALAVAKTKELVRYGVPEDTGGRGRWWVRWQNLSAEEVPQADSLPFHGRAWVYFAPDGASKLQFSWHLKSSFAHVGLRVDADDAEVGVMAALPPVALWFTFESWSLLGRRLRAIGNREARVSVHDAAIWWHLWTDPYGWTSSTPRWREGSFHPVDFLLGKTKVEHTELGIPVPVQVPLPEGNYEGTVQLYNVQISRPRWFSSHRRTARVEMRQPIPVPGKGENSWDCDEDEIYVQSCPARSIAEVVASVVESVLRTRERHGGLDWKPEAKKPEPPAGEGESSGGEGQWLGTGNQVAPPSPSVDGRVHAAGMAMVFDPAEVPLTAREIPVSQGHPVVLA